MSAERPPRSATSPALPALLPRRHFLSNSSGSLASVALAWMIASESRADAPAGVAGTSGLHFPAKAKRVVQIFCSGGVSHLETFDPKPELERLHGKSLEGKGENLGFFGQPGTLMKSVYPFARHGKSGSWVSDLLPRLAGVADELCFIHSMVAKSNNHTPATFQMNSGFTLNGFPCMGAWLSYGLGTLSDDLPAFVVLPDPRGQPAGGSINWTSGFLPANHQGVAFRTDGGDPIADLHTPPGVDPARRQADLRLLEAMNRDFAGLHPGDDGFAARIRSYELAARMQASIPGATDFADEPRTVRELYGIEDPTNKGFSRNCLMARRLLERGVRFVQVFNGGSFGSPRINWDGHENMKENHDAQAATMDRPVAALIEDLRQRGMLDDTLVVWSTEFGRSPVTQGIGSTGRDHHPKAFTCFLAGAGVKRGHHHGATDDVGYEVAENPVTIPDFHATILALLGIDHERLTYYHNGVNRRLTDVHGHVIRGVLA
jgi:hypothetical protein